MPQEAESGNTGATPDKGFNAELEVMTQHKDGFERAIAGKPVDVAETITHMRELVSRAGEYGVPDMMALFARGINTILREEHGVVIDFQGLPQKDLDKALQDTKDPEALKLLNLLNMVVEVQNGRISREEADKRLSEYKG